MLICVHRLNNLLILIHMANNHNSNEWKTQCLNQQNVLCAVENVLLRDWRSVSVCVCAVEELSNSLPQGTNEQNVPRLCLLSPTLLLFPCFVFDWNCYQFKMYQFHLIFPHFLFHFALGFFFLFCFECVLFRFI